VSLRTAGKLPRRSTASEPSNETLAARGAGVVAVLGCCDIDEAVTGLEWHVRVGDTFLYRQLAYRTNMLVEHRGNVRKSFRKSSDSLKG